MDIEAPDLVIAEAREGARARLRGGRCGTCGFVAFPHYPYGCEACGAAGLDPLELAGEGVVRTAIAVHRTRDGKPEGVATIALDDGPVIRAVLGTAAPLPRPGTRVRAILRPLPHKAGVLGLRFQTSE